MGCSVLGGDIPPALADRDHQFCLMMQILRQAWVGQSGAAGHNGIRGFGEKERRIAFIIAKFPSMFGVITPDAENAPHSKALGAA